MQLQKARYKPPLPPSGAGKLRGGLRLVLCDRPNMTPGMTISKHAYEQIHRAFGLHDATLPAFFTVGGAFSSFLDRKPRAGTPPALRVVVRATQKVEIANWTLSLRHDLETGWTYAFLCGEGVIHDRPVDAVYGSHRGQLLALIRDGIREWDNPLFLPCCLLQCYTWRLETRSAKSNRDMNDVESEIGVTYAAGSGLDGERDIWPRNLDPRRATIALHSLLPQLVYLARCCQWLREYTKLLLDLGSQLSADETFRRHQRSLMEIRETILFMSSITDGISTFFSTAKERATWQVSVLFSAISQQDSLRNRWDSRLTQLIARSQKQDSISMTTFTFITALFLPGTFVATLFSMTMFSWDDVGSGDSSGQPPTSYVTGKFWIFWTVAVPLTAITMAGWYLWFRFANSHWMKELSSTANIDESSGLIPPFDTSASNSPKHNYGDRLRPPFAAHYRGHPEDAVLERLPPSVFLSEQMEKGNAGFARGFPSATEAFRPRFLGRDD